MKNNQICKGYRASRFDETSDEMVETLYAVLSDGTVLKSDERRFSISFNRPGFAVSNMTPDQVKATAEFIGNYPVPAL